jgi:hypothetical protein
MCELDCVACWVGVFLGCVFVFSSVYYVENLVFGERVVVV